MDTRFLSHRDSSSVSQQSKRKLGSEQLGVRSSELQNNNSEFRIPNSEFKKVCAAVRAGNSVLVLGEAGTGKGDFAQALHKEMLGEFQTAIATYKGSLKKFFVAIARITSNENTVVFELHDEGLIRGEVLYRNRAAISFDVRGNQICATREYLGSDGKFSQDYNLMV